MTKPSQLSMGILLAALLAGCQAVGPAQQLATQTAPQSSGTEAPGAKGDLERSLGIQLGNVSLQLALPIPDHAVRREAGYGVQALDSYFYTNVTKVKVTVIGADFASPVVANFDVDNGTTTLSRQVNIPAGKNRVFVVEAWDHQAPNHNAAFVARIATVADVSNAGNNQITINQSSLPAGLVFQKLINDALGGNSAANTIARSGDHAPLDTWVRAQILKQNETSKKYETHPTLVDTDALADYLKANAGALPADNTAATYTKGGTVKVTVRNRRDQSALSGATVAANDFATDGAGVTADTNGVYTLAGVTPGTWTVSVSAPNTVNGTALVTVPAKGTANVTIDLTGDMAVKNLVGGGNAAYADGISGESMALANPVGAAIFTNPNDNVATNYKDLLFFAENNANGNIYRVNADRTVTRFSTGAVKNPHKMKFDPQGNLWVAGSAAVDDTASSAADGGLFRFDRLADGTLKPTPTKVITNNSATIGSTAGPGGWGFNPAVGGFDIGPDGTVIFQGRSHNHYYYYGNGLNYYYRRSEFYKIELDGRISSLGVIIPDTINGANSVPAANIAGKLADVTVDSKGQLYKTTTGGIQQYVTNTWVNWLGGLNGVGGHNVDRTDASVKANMPGFMRFDAHGTMVFSDSSNYAVRQVAGTGKVSTMAGNMGATAPNPVIGLSPIDPAVRFKTLGQTVADSQGNQYIVDSGANRIYRIHTADGAATLNASF